MSDVKIIINGDADIELAVTALEALWAAGASQVSLVRNAPVAIDISVITGTEHGMPSRTDSMECNECGITLCTHCRHEQAIARAQQQVEADEAALIRSTERLREVVIHG